MNAREKKIIIAGVKAAGDRAKRMMIKENDSSDISQVNDFDYKIPADKISENIILKAIKKSGINCKIIAEESGIIYKDGAEYKVYIDPVDGSVNYSKGIPVFCSGVGIFSYKDEPLLGIIYDPNHKELFVAEKGKGITLNGKKFLPKLHKNDNLLINLEWFGASNCVKVIDKLCQNKFRARIAGSGILAILYGSIGRGDGAILIKNRPWDIAPGMPFAKESGFVIKQADGKEIDLSQDKIDMVVAPERLFDKIFNCIK